VLARSTPGRERAFLGWFGPLGVSAIYYAVSIGEEIPTLATPIFTAVSLGVVGSVVMHSFTATPAVRAMGGRDPSGTLRHPLEHDVEEERDPR
jgi:NhaP-type Na+/H+ or K+/H+ antiporter